MFCVKRFQITNVSFVAFHDHEAKRIGNGFSTSEKVNDGISTSSNPAPYHDEEVTTM